MPSSIMHGRKCGPEFQGIDNPWFKNVLKSAVPDHIEFSARNLFSKFEYARFNLSIFEKISDFSNFTRVGNFGNNFVIKVFDQSLTLFSVVLGRKSKKNRRTVVRVLEIIEPTLESISVSLEK